MNELSHSNDIEKLPKKLTVGIRKAAGFATPINPNIENGRQQKTQKC